MYYFENHHLDTIGRGRDAENKYRLYVAFEHDADRKVIGYLSYTTLDGYNELHIDFVEVMETLRGQGIGKALYSKLFDLNKSLTFGNELQFVRASYYTEHGKHIREWFEREFLKNRATEYAFCGNKL